MQAIRKNIAVDRGKYLKFSIDTSLGIGDSFTIPTIIGPAYNYSVRWGDGSVSTGVTGSTTRTYASSGVYNIEIKGEFPQFYFNNGGDKSKLISIVQWGKTNLRTNQIGAFYGCTNLTSIHNDVKYLNTITAGSNMFRSCSKLASLPNGLKLANLIDGTNMFSSCILLSNLPNSLTLAALTNAQNMFLNTVLTDLPVGITLSNLSLGYQMFFGVTISKTRYSQLLIDMQTSNSNNTKSFHGGNSKYNAAGKVARDILTGSPRNWTITDGGYAP
jgi:hypothetical protein